MEYEEEEKREGGGTRRKERTKKQWRKRKKKEKQICHSYRYILRKKHTDSKERNIRIQKLTSPIIRGEA